MDTENPDWTTAGVVMERFERGRKSLSLRSTYIRNSINAFKRAELGDLASFGEEIYKQTDDFLSET